MPHHQTSALRTLLITRQQGPVEEWAHAWAAGGAKFGGVVFVPPKIIRATVTNDPKGEESLTVLAEQGVGMQFDCIAITTMNPLTAVVS